MTQSINKKLFSSFLKRRSVPFGQHRGDQVEVGDEVAANERLQAALQLIGEVVFVFSTLESMLADHLCEIINDRSDEPGVIILHGMLYRQRVDLFERLNRSFLGYFDSDAKQSARAMFGPLIDELRDLGELRNQVVHADWGTIDEQGYATVKTNMTLKGLHESRMLFDEGFFDALVGRITAATQQFDDFIQMRELLLMQRPK